MRPRRPENRLAEIFRRMAFNVLIGNTDDHARNHALFWDGEAYELTPAYDLCPILRSGRTAAQAMVVGSDRRASTIANVLSEAPQFGLDPDDAAADVEELVESVRREWPGAADRAGLTTLQRRQLERETVLGPGCFS